MPTLLALLSFLNFAAMLLDLPPLLRVFCFGAGVFSFVASLASFILSY